MNKLHTRTDEYVERSFHLLSIYIDTDSKLVTLIDDTQDPASARRSVELEVPDEVPEKRTQLTESCRQLQRREGHRSTPIIVGGVVTSGRR